MPCKNAVKNYNNGSFYHVYNRGVNKQNIFICEDDYRYFVMLLSRYLTPQQNEPYISRKHGYLGDKVTLQAYCLMPNHFHMLLQQEDDRGIEKLLRAICTSYVMYFNKKYGRVGHLFQGVFKASEINSDSYLAHISRYIHRNPVNYMEWPYSSYRYYVSKKYPSWINPSYILDSFTDDSYKQYMVEGILAT